MELPGKRQLRLIQVYAPPSSWDDEKYNSFLADLEETPAGRYAYDVVIGDLNAVVSKMKPENIW